MLRRPGIMIWQRLLPDRRDYEQLRAIITMLYPGREDVVCVSREGCASMIMILIDSQVRNCWYSNISLHFVSIEPLIKLLVDRTSQVKSCSSGVINY